MKLLKSKVEFSIKQRLLLFMGAIFSAIMIAFIICTILLCQKINIDKMILLSDIFTQQTMSNMENAVNQIDSQYFQSYCASQIPELLNSIENEKNPSVEIYDVVGKDAFTYYNTENLSLSDAILWEMTEIAFNKSEIESITIRDKNGSYYFYDKMCSSPEPHQIKSFEERLPEISLKNGYSKWTVESGNIIIERELYYRSSTPIGYLSIEIRDDYFNEIVKSGTIAENQFVLYNKTGNILLENSNQFEPDFLTYIFDQVSEWEKNEQYATGIISYQGTSYLVSSHVEAKSDWVLVNIVPYSNVMDMLRPFFLWIVAVGFAAFLFAFLFIYWFSNHLSERIQAIVKKMQAMSHGDFLTPIQFSTQDEITLIADSLNGLGAKMDHLLKQSVLEKQRYYEMKLEMMEIQMSALNAQLNPHFLYNALETISSMALLDSSPRVSTALCDFAELLRINVKKRESASTLADEIQYLKDYLKVMKVITNERISMIFHVEDSVLDFTVPSFFLYPIIENSIVHNLDNVNDDIVITVICKRSKTNKVQIMISDNGVGVTHERISQENEFLKLCLCNPDKFPVDQDVSGHIGLKNIAKTMGIFYGASASITLQGNIPCGLSVMLQLPDEPRLKLGTQK